MTIEITVAATLNGTSALRSATVFVTDATAGPILVADTTTHAGSGGSSSSVNPALIGGIAGGLGALAVILLILYCIYARHAVQVKPAPSLPRSGEPQKDVVDTVTCL